MQIEKDKVVAVKYKLFEGDTLLEESTESEPMLYLHGHDNILSSLEDALSGKKQDDSVDVELTPEQAYGVYREGAVERIPKKYMFIDKSVKAGDIVAVNTTEGPRDVRVIKVGRFNVDIDPNHPYAGKTLRFEMQVLSVRDANEEELSHGHAHGHGGHQH